MTEVNDRVQILSSTLFQTINSVAVNFAISSIAQKAVKREVFENFFSVFPLVSHFSYAIRTQTNDKLVETTNMLHLGQNVSFAGVTTLKDVYEEVLHNNKSSVFDTVRKMQLCPQPILRICAEQKNDIFIVVPMPKSSQLADQFNTLQGANLGAAQPTASADDAPVGCLIVGMKDAHVHEQRHYMAKLLVLANLLGPRVHSCCILLSDMLKEKESPMGSTAAHPAVTVAMAASANEPSLGLHTPLFEALSHITVQQPQLHYSPRKRAAQEPFPADLSSSFRAQIRDLTKLPEHRPGLVPPHWGASLNAPAPMQAFNSQTFGQTIRNWAAPDVMSLLAANQAAPMDVERPAKVAKPAAERESASASPLATVVSRAIMQHLEAMKDKKPPNS